MPFLHLLDEPSDDVDAGCRYVSEQLARGKVSACFLGRVGDGFGLIVGATKISAASKGALVGVELDHAALLALRARINELLKGGALG